MSQKPDELCVLADFCDPPLDDAGRGRPPSTAADEIMKMATLAHARLIAIDLGATYTGVAIRVCRQAGPRPCGLVEKVARRAGRDDLGYDWVLQREARAYSRTATMVTRHESQADALATVFAEQRVAAAVVGMPYHANGARSPQCDIVERNVARLQAAWTQPMPILYWDESYSTVRAVGPKRKDPKSRAGRRSHAAAACLILEEVLRELAPLEAASDAAQMLAPLRETLR